MCPTWMGHLLQPYNPSHQIATGLQYHLEATGRPLHLLMGFPSAIEERLLLVGSR